MNDGRPFEFDAFISYSSQDKAWVRGELLPRIEQAGLKAIIDIPDFAPGERVLVNIQNAVRRSRHTLLVLTPNWFGSQWTRFEGLLGATNDPANTQRRLIPLLRRQSEFPENTEFIAALTYVDFTDDADHKLSWRQLLTALGRPPVPEPTKEPESGEWRLIKPYPMPPNFTGRALERSTLTNWLGGDAARPLLMLRALGGFGKSALTWQWLMNDVQPAIWPRVIWWSFYEADSSFDDFVRVAFEYLTGKEVKQPGPRQQLASFVHLLKEPGSLFILDGFERVLRAFSGLDAVYQGDISDRPNDCDCVSPLAEEFLRDVCTLPGIRTKVLLTTRLRPRVLEGHGGSLLQGCREVELTELQPIDAVEFFRIQGIRGTHAEIDAACATYGYHPLSLRLLAGTIVRDFQTPGDIAAVSHLDVSGDLVQRQHHVLAMAYDRLSPAQQELLGRIACLRSPVKYESLREFAETNTFSSPSHRVIRFLGHRVRKLIQPHSSGKTRSAAATLDGDLHDLIARGLLHHEVKGNRLDLHPIVRRYAYDRLTARDRTVAHTRLRNYFAAVPSLDKVTRLEDLTPVIELYHHTVRAGHFHEAYMLFRERLAEPLFFQFCAYQIRIDLLHALFANGEAEDSAPHLTDELDQAWTFNSLANSYSLNGQPHRAARAFEQAIAIAERRDDKSNLATDLGNLASMALLPVGALHAAVDKLDRRISLSIGIDDRLKEAIGRQELGRLLAYLGRFVESETELKLALDFFENQGDEQRQCVVWARRTLGQLLRCRCESKLSTQSALTAARRAFELADLTAQKRFPFERDYVRVHRLLGAALYVAQEYDESDKRLDEALQRCRKINAVDTEADILIDLARLRAATGAPDEVHRLSEEALAISNRCGYVLQSADAHLELAKLALTRGNSTAAKGHAQQAREFATCDGPGYTYKAAYDEAGELLKQLT